MWFKETPLYGLPGAYFITPTPHESRCSDSYNAVICGLEISDEIDQSYAHGRAPEEQDGPFWPRWEISGSDDEPCGELDGTDNEQMKAKGDSGHGPERRPVLGESGER